MAAFIEPGLKVRKGAVGVTDAPFDIENTVWSGAANRGEDAIEGIVVGVKIVPTRRNDIVDNRRWDARPKVS
jgi:hypothetical protein